MPKPSDKPMSPDALRAISKRLGVAERIRYFESRHTNNVYIVGHGFLNVVRSDIAYKKKKGTFKKILLSLFVLLLLTEPESPVVINGPQSRCLKQWARALLRPMNAPNSRSRWA